MIFATARAICWASVLNEKAFAKTAVLVALTATKTAEADFKRMLGRNLEPNIFKLLRRASAEPRCCSLSLKMVEPSCSERRLGNWLEFFLLRAEVSEHQNWTVREITTDDLKDLKEIQTWASEVLRERKTHPLALPMKGPRQLIQYKIHFFPPCFIAATTSP